MDDNNEIVLEDDEQIDLIREDLADTFSDDEIIADAPAVAHKLTNAANDTSPKRLSSLGALRGFSMFWIIGGAAFVLALANALGKHFNWGNDLMHWVRTLDLQMTHVDWSAANSDLLARSWIPTFHFYDFIFPLFVFVMGAAVPFAMGRRVDEATALGRKAPLWRLQGKIIWRTLVLILIGISFTFFGKFFGMKEGVPTYSFENVRFFTVLWLIAMSYFIGASLMLYVRNWKSRLILVFAVLIGYHLAMFYLPYPSKAELMTSENNLASWIDRWIDTNFFNTSLYRGFYDPEGSIRVITGGMLCILGGIAGKRLREFETPNIRAVGELILGSIGCLAIGYGWSYLFPMAKDFWTPSFVLWAAGWGMLLLALFYMVMDVWRQKWVGWIFIPIGMNAILIYASQRFIPWEHVGDFIFQGYAKTIIHPHWQHLLLTGGLLLVQWLVLFWLYRKKAFIRI